MEDNGHHEFRSGRDQTDFTATEKHCAATLLEDYRFTQGAKFFSVQTFENGDVSSLKGTSHLLLKNV